MILRLSATSIQDYMECPKRFWYRTNAKDKAVVSDHVVFGSIVHEAIEKFEDSETAVKWAVKEWPERMKQEFEFAELPVSKPPKSFSKMLGNYYTKILPDIEHADPFCRECMFDVPWVENQELDVRIIGKMDLISGLHVYDWKTGARKPTKYQLQSFQFYLYEWAYEKMYGRRPNIYYGYLNGGDIIPIDMNDALRDDVHNTINSTINNLKNEIFYRVTGYQCANCFYRAHCYNEMEVGVGLEY